MLSYLTLAIILTTLFLIEVTYFKIAEHFKIIDNPNARSSHNSITLRGGGIIFTVSAILWFLIYSSQFPYFFVGLISITLVSFLDDILTLANKIRLMVHLSAVILLFFQWNLFALPWYWLFFALVFVIAVINAYNFMDGINGITGLYSFLAIITLYYVNVKIVNFTDSNLLIIVGLSLLVFNFFNFRTKAKCFAGDVGSVSIAFILIFLIGQLILVTNNFGYIILLLVYGLDTVTTVLFRKLRRENIFEAHRSHFYQYLANQLHWNHLKVTGLYIFLQMTCNFIFIIFIRDNLIATFSVACFALIVFLVARFSVEGKNYLLKRSSHNIKV